MNKHTLRFIWGLIQLVFSTTLIDRGINRNGNFTFEVIEIGLGIFIAWIGISNIEKSIE